LTTEGFNPSWSPDGNEIVYASEEQSDPTSRNSTASLSIVNLSSGVVRRLNNGDAMGPVFSPHGKRIAYWALPPSKGGAQRDIYTVAVNGDPKTVVHATNDEALDWNPVWSPDGGSILFVSDRGGTTNLWRQAIDEESGVPKGVPEPLPVPASAIGNISLSRDGRKVLYVSAMTTQEVKLGRFDPDTLKVTIEEKPLLAGSTLLRNFEPSPDGQWVAFTTSARQEDLYVARSDGSEVRQLTNDMARDRGVSWVSDSSRILTYSSRGGEYEAWSIRVDGSELKPLTRGAAVNFPIISADGTKLAYFDLDSSRIAKLDGGIAGKGEALPGLPGTEKKFRACAWSPDGTKLVGTTWLAGTEYYIYSLADRSYRTIDSLPIMRTGTEPNARSSVAWVDDHRLLLALKDGSLVLADIVAKTAKVVGTASNAALARNGRTFLVSNKNREGDVWEMELGAK
jgi:Tol biopolymer transport system component